MGRPHPGLRQTAVGRVADQFGSAGQGGDAVPRHQRSRHCHRVLRGYRHHSAWRCLQPASGKLTYIDDPDGAQGIVLNGINGKGEIVGFYTDGAGNVHGMLATGRAVRTSCSG